MSLDTGEFDEWYNLRRDMAYEKMKKAIDDLEGIVKLVKAKVAMKKLTWQQAEIAQLEKQIAGLQGHSPGDHVNGA